MDELNIEFSEGESSTFGTEQEGLTWPLLKKWRERLEKAFLHDE